MNTDRKERIGLVFGSKRPIIGVLHLSGETAQEKLAIAQQEIRTLYKGGVHAVMVQDYYGVLADVERVLVYLQKEYADKVYGVNILNALHGEEIAFRLARQYHAAFVQIDSVCGHLSPDKEEPWLRRLQELRGDGEIFLLGGVRYMNDHPRSGRTMEQDLHLAMQRCDAIVVNGAAAGTKEEIAGLRQIRAYIEEFPLVIGSGITVDTWQKQLEIADGAIVGSYFKKDGKRSNLVDPNRVEFFMLRSVPWEITCQAAFSVVLDHPEAYTDVPAYLSPTKKWERSPYPATFVGWAYSGEYEGTGSI